MTRKYYKKDETERQDQFYPSNTNGCPIWYFMKNFAKLFQGKAGVYCISVFMPSYRRFIKIGISTNMAVRMNHYQTALFPIWKHARIHALFIKRSDRIQQRDFDEGGAMPSALKRAEKRIHDELLSRKIDHCGPEWFHVSVNEAVKIMALFHFGSKELGERADGHNCEAYIFGGLEDKYEMIRVEDDFINAIELAEPKRHEGVERKMTEKMRASKQQESERKQVPPELKALPKKRTTKVTLKMKESIAQARQPPTLTLQDITARAQSKSR